MSDLHVEWSVMGAGVKQESPQEAAGKVEERGACILDTGGWTRPTGGTDGQVGKRDKVTKGGIPRWLPGFCLGKGLCSC